MKPCEVFFHLRQHHFVDGLRGFAVQIKEVLMHCLAHRGGNVVLAVHVMVVSASVWCSGQIQSWQTALSVR